MASGMLPHRTPWRVVAAVKAKHATVIPALESHVQLHACAALEETIAYRESRSWVEQAL
jgi:hypothetical protein